MKLLMINGSTRAESSNGKLLRALQNLYTSHHCIIYRLDSLPMYQTEDDRAPWNPKVLEWRENVNNADLVIIATPEYLHNIPAQLKNAFEWVNTSGEMQEKRVLPITFTPHLGRGEKAMKTLIWTLQALQSNIIGQLSLYQNEIIFDNHGKFTENEHFQILKESLEIFQAS